MKKRINSNWLLIGAFLFFIASAGFSTTTTTNQSATADACGYVCDLAGCVGAEGDQIGALFCDMDYVEWECNLSAYCLPTPVID